MVMFTTWMAAVCRQVNNFGMYPTT